MVVSCTKLKRTLLLRLSSFIIDIYKSVENDVITSLKKYLFY